MDFFEIVKNIASVLGLIVTATTVIGLCTKGGRALVRKIVTRNTEDLRESNSQQDQDLRAIKDAVQKMDADLQILKKFSVQQCRDTLKDIYYRYHRTKQIPLYERKTADKVFELYVNDFHENSYAKLLYEEICKWEVIAMSPEDIHEE